MKNPSAVKDLLFGIKERSRKHRVNIYVDLQVYERFQTLCEQRGVSVSSLLNAYMVDFVREQEPPMVSVAPKRIG